MYSIKERFYFTIAELEYIETSNLTIDQQRLIENAITILEKHLKNETYDLNDAETEIIIQATNYIGE